MAHQGERITTVAGPAIVVRGNDIDTDRIIPARYMKVVTFDGLGEYAFRDVRYTPDGSATDHPFNDPKRRDAKVLLVNRNFGCGSSREHAPQALMRWGIRGIVGESFAEIFAGNCNALGIPAVTVTDDAIGELMKLADADASAPVTIDLDRSVVSYGTNEVPIQVPETYRQSLVSGNWDSTRTLLANEASIRQTASRLPYVSGFATA